MTESYVLLDQEPDPRGVLSLGGRVVSEDGRVVGAARVAVDSVPSRETMTDEAGRFSFEELVPRSYRVRATSDDAWGMTTVWLTRAAQDVAVRLQLGVTVTARVIDARDDKPIAAARVSIGNVSAMTSPVGEATLRPIPTGWADIETSGSGYASMRTTSIVSVAPMNRVEIRLSPGSSIAGRVVDEHDKPVADASIYVVDDAPTPASGTTAVAVTDDDGHFRVDDVSTGVRRILAVDGRHAPTMSRPLVVEAEPVDVVVTMSEGARLDGRVVDGAGVAVARAIVRVDSADRSYSRQTVSGDDGRFTIHGLGKTIFHLRAEAAPDVSETKVVDLTAAKAQSIEVGLLPTGAIAGTVVDNEGKPYGDAVVNAIFTVNDAVTSSVVSDRNGRFIMGDLPEGQYLVWSGRYSEPPPLVEEAIASTGDTKVLVRKPTFGAVRGQIAVQDAAHLPTDALVMISGISVGIEQTYRALGTGVFEFEGLPPDDYQMTIRGPGFVEATVEVKVAAGRVTDVGKVGVLRGRMISGRVVDELARPISAARLYIGPKRFGVDPDSLVEPWSRTSDADGRFTITGLDDSVSYLLLATHRGGCSRGIVLPPMATDISSLDVVMLPCGSVGGTVKAAGRPARSVLVTIGDPRAETAMTDENGAFAFARFPRGVTPIRVRAQGSFTPLFDGEVEVQAGKQADLTLDIGGSAP